MQSNQLLYQAFPVELREAYKEAVRTQDWGGRHGGMLDFAEASLRYLASLCLSDYRTRSSTPVRSVEERLTKSRNRNLTLGGVLELFRASATVMPDALVPGPADFPSCDLTATGRFAGAVEAIMTATDGLNRDASPSVIDVAVHVERSLAEAEPASDWWRSWEGIVMYRNKVAHPTQSRWPTRSRDYWEIMGPLLHDAIVELMTHAAVADAVLDHPVANVTLISPAGDGRYSHSVCGESRGVWFERDIFGERPITERWVDEHWGASTASSYILDPTAGGWEFRSLFWDLRNGLPPAMDMRLGEVDRDELAPGPEAGAARPQTAQEGRGTAPGTCGEFLQGILPDGTPFHVTCPINKSATVVAQIRPAEKLSIAGLHAYHRKLALAIEFAVEELDIGPAEVTIRHWSDLDIGKGMGSSTADVLAGIRAVAGAVAESLDPTVEGRIAARVESSDGSMYRGIAAVNHKTCALVKAWDWYPEFVIVMLVPHDSVDTHSISFAGQEALAGEYEDLLGQMDRAVAERSISAFAQQSTRSVALNERFLFNPYARKLADRLDEFDALGVNVGHTGTVCGLLFPNTEGGRLLASDACFALRKEFPELKGVKVVTTPHCPGSPTSATERANRR